MDPLQHDQPRIRARCVSPMDQDVTQRKLLSPLRDLLALAEERRLKFEVIEVFQFDLAFFANIHFFGRADRNFDEVFTHEEVIFEFQRQSLNSVRHVRIERLVLWVWRFVQVRSPEELNFDPCSFLSGIRGVNGNKSTDDQAEEYGWNNSESHRLLNFINGIRIRKFLFRRV